MKRRQVLPALAAGFTSAAAAHEGDAFITQWRDSFLKHWKVTAEYTIAVADAMPEDAYTFKPTDAQRNFAEQMVHLGRANVAYMTAFGIVQPPAPPAPTETSKKVVRAYLTASFDFVTEVITKASTKELARTDLKLGRLPAHSATDLCMRAYMHTAHHRGQLVVYLRLKGIVPPTWAFEPTV
ncbi:MAG: DinB family protein [Acidimicrobiia bacterium]|nr:DinB family protein [Acidimicrobiia bacterium]